jgi:hypothetical protein
MKLPGVSADEIGGTYARWTKGRAAATPVRVSRPTAQNADLARTASASAHFLWGTGASAYTGVGSPS